MRVAVIGAGWAGMAAAVAAASAGHQVTVFEASRELGGRARGIAGSMPGADHTALDNGQHILIGAYCETLGLMSKVGVNVHASLLRMPLAMRFPDGTGLLLPYWTAPLEAAAGILTAKGWSARDKLTLLRAAMRWRRQKFQCSQHESVLDVCHDLSPRVMQQLIEPLCVSALNTPAEKSSGEIFLRVLQDALFSKGHEGFGGSNLLLPRRDLSSLFPLPAAQWLGRSACRTLTGRRIETLQAVSGQWRVDSEPFDRVVLACPAREAARLAQASGCASPEWIDLACGLEHAAITTVYLAGGPRLALPMLALHSGPTAPAQFVFDRSQLGGPRGMLAFVVSASQGERQALQTQVVAQAQALGWQGLVPVQTVVEKRATFVCTPGVTRPQTLVAPGLLACGDYVQGPYPATLEGAVRSGLAAAQMLARAGNAPA